MSLSDAQGFAFGGGVGGAFFVRDNISVDLSLNYLHSSLKRFYAGYTSSGTVKNNNPLRANMDEIKVFVGFSVYL
jgi:opacity protein-like surface antigen